MYRGDNKANYPLQVIIGRTYIPSFFIVCLFVCLFSCLRFFLCVALVAVLGVVVIQLVEPD